MHALNSRPSGSKRSRGRHATWPRIAACLWLATVAFGCGPDARDASRVQLFAASSTVDAIENLRERFERESGFDVELTIAGSASLARQIGAGAEADLFLSANTQWADVAATTPNGSSRAIRRCALLENHLVVIAPARSALELHDLAGLATLPVATIALANPDSVPAGIYAREALEHAGVWTALESRIIAGDNVRTALAYVEDGGVPIGIVYASDAQDDARVRVVFDIDPRDHLPVVYPLLLLRRRAGETPGAAELYEFLTSPAAGDVFRQYAFTPSGVPDPAPPERPSR